MKIFELLDELKEEIENSPKAVFSNKRTIDIDICFEIIDDIQRAIPNDVKKAEEMLKEKERIIKGAEEEADSIVSSAEDELKTRVSENSVIQEAEIKAKELLKLAENNAREITLGSKEYADDILGELEKYLAGYIELIRKNRSELSVRRKQG